MTHSLQTALGLSPAATAGVASIVLVAALVRGLTGFGFAILAVPLLGLVIPPDRAVIVAIIMQMLIGPFGVRHTIGVIDRGLVARIAAVACLTTPAGLWLLSAVSADAARLMIAGIALACFFGFLADRSKPAATSPASVIATGASSGVLNGFAAMPGPPVVLYFVRDAIRPEVARGSMLMIFFATATAGTLTAWWRGMIDTGTLWLALAALPIMIAGNHIGSAFFGRIPEKTWRRVVIALLVAAAAGAVLKLLR
jgi:uncharacterized membrane protein YfcA